MVELIHSGFALSPKVNTEYVVKQVRWLERKLLEPSTRMAQTMIVTMLVEQQEVVHPNKGHGEELFDDFVTIERNEGSGWLSRILN